MEKYNWVIFQPVNYQEFCEVLDLDSSTKQKNTYWLEWQEFYSFNSKHFYLSQLERHLKHEFYKFCRSNKLIGKDIWDLGTTDSLEKEMWSEWLENSPSYLEHKNIAYSLAYAKDSEYEMQTKTINTFGDFIELLKSSLSKDDLEKVKSFWFNKNISSNSKPEVTKLYNLPYQEYLKSHHWYKVRSAMILIERAKCNRCLANESYYGSNREWQCLEVHHLDYKNKGNEKYQDLELLCEKHHRQAHNH